MSTEKSNVSAPSASRCYPTANEMQRRQAMVRAKSDLTDQMAKHSLTAMEWVNVLNETMQRMVQHGLKEEWAEPHVCDFRKSIDGGTEVCKCGAWR